MDPISYLTCLPLSQLMLFPLILFLSFSFHLNSCSHHDAANTSYSALPPAKDDEDMMDDALDYAIENGNWEQVAASAAALVEREN